MRNNTRVNFTRNLIIHHNHHKSQKYIHSVLNTCKISGIRYINNLLLLLKCCSLITWLGSSATKHCSTIWTCQHNVYASVSLTKRAWTHQWNATLSPCGCSTWELASNLNMGSAESGLWFTLWGTQDISITQ